MNPKEQAEQLMKRLDLIISIAQNGYFKDGNICDYTGKNESWLFYREYVKQFYEPLYENDKNFEFVDIYKFPKCAGNMLFNGEYVRIKEETNCDSTKKYYVFCVPVWKLKGCYDRALKVNPSLFHN